jgi:beta-lactam-binding protein with PASTA domain
VSVRNIAFSVVLVGVGVVGGLFLRPILLGNSSPNAAVVPSVVGFSEHAATAKLLANGFGFLSVPVVHRNPSWVVYRQFPAAGTAVSRRDLTIYTRAR